MGQGGVRRKWQKCRFRREILREGWFGGVAGYAFRQRSRRHPRLLEGNLQDDARSLPGLQTDADRNFRRHGFRIRRGAFQAEGQIQRSEKHRKISRDLEARTRHLESVLRLLELEQRSRQAQLKARLNISRMPKCGRSLSHETR